MHARKAEASNGAVGGSAAAVKLQDKWALASADACYTLSLELAVPLEALADYVARPKRDVVELYLPPFEHYAIGEPETLALALPAAPTRGMLDRSSRAAAQRERELILF